MVAFGTLNIHICNPSILIFSSFRDTSITIELAKWCKVQCLTTCAHKILIWVSSFNEYWSHCFFNYKSIQNCFYFQCLHWNKIHSHLYPIGPSVSINITQKAWAFKDWQIITVVWLWVMLQNKNIFDIILPVNLIPQITFFLLVLKGLSFSCH